ncbi:hypothetical protein ALC62_03471 [Cyphomyrmex costatus]|uniref:Endonuclease/exonuclease/phosphatase domain-containing protein n=1 Tax=Cyphomyrmex costatus TaxID=456900 RepID=A0A151ILH0_9HYME|nr:hypothetical protein ALC62_03471 [Cyphomyrmex costatus]
MYIYVYGNREREGVIIAKLGNYEEKRLVMVNKKNLADREGYKNIYINDDMTKGERVMQAKLRLKAKSERISGANVKVAYGRMWVNGKEWMWNEGSKSVVEKEFYRNTEIQMEGAKKSSCNKKVNEKRKLGKCKVLFWNIAGINSNNKIFLDWIKEHDVIIFIETWLESKNWDVFKKNLLKEWIWENVGANKKMIRGRAMGGIILGIRKGIAVEKIKLDKEWLIECRIRLGEKKWRIVGVYNKEGNRDRLQELDNITKEGDEEFILVGGDFNVRIGEGGEMGWEGEGRKEIERKSKDEVLNKEGEELLRSVEEKGWVIMNGNKQGDEEGEWTYEKGLNKSVIDYYYCITSMRTWDKVSKFKVIERVESDHNALVVEGEIEGVIEREEERVIQDWSEKGIKVYKERVEEMQWNIVNNSAEEWEDMRKKLGEAVSKNKRKESTMIMNTKPWWDRESWEGKKKLRKILREAKKRKEVEISKAREEYKKLCEQKLKEWRIKEEEVIKNVKTDVQAWRYVNKYRKKREGINREIKLEEWKKNVWTDENEEKRKYLWRCGMSVEKWECSVKNADKLKQRDVEVQRQENYNSMENSEYNYRYKDIKTLMLPKYLTEKENKKANEKCIIARARCGNLE